jgi:hypothetical protein
MISSHGKDLADCIQEALIPSKQTHFRNGLLTECSNGASPIASVGSYVGAARIPSHEPIKTALVVYRYHTMYCSK